MNKKTIEEFVCTISRRKNSTERDLNCDGFYPEGKFIQKDVYITQQIKKLSKSFNFLKTSFSNYYKDTYNGVMVDSFSNREFGFGLWEKVFFRHKSFTIRDQFSKFLSEKSPRHVYYSASIYSNPTYEMDLKDRQGCDFFVDIDADHFETSCKQIHDYWVCKDCGNMGRGSTSECPNCSNDESRPNIKNNYWLCDKCLEASKKQLQNLIYDFLIPDFDINLQDCRIAYSGHRGYHLLIKDQHIRSLSSIERTEIIDYLTGNNISFNVLGLKKEYNSIYGLSKQYSGWEGKIMKYFENMLITFTDRELTTFLEDCSLSFYLIEGFLNYRNNFLKLISNNKKFLWSIEGFQINDWSLILQGIANKIGVKIDRPVSLDLSRLVRYPNSLHGKTGFIVQALNIADLDDFKPLDESSPHLDPVFFYSNKHHKLKIIQTIVPEITIKGKRYGPFMKDEVIEVPNHIAIFLLCKEVAEMF